MPTDYNDSSRTRRDFRQTHGGPEELPIRRKKVKVDRSKCDHKWSPWDNRQFKSERYWFEHGTRFCESCRKRDYFFKSGSVVS